ncbi:hypothetical protein AF63_05115 [Streptococcus uberis Ab71]|uniref:glycosyltransferase family 2 protein n=1 Tax=Streptococcus uberis TaxID=1349 RepID=UPI00062042AC|nr:glycosyltransferase family 2 protein [Streptococcus uberis]KKF42412.1 hypothetical protein AF63_05115 [Streptococcus uberis Ab71]
MIDIIMGTYNGEEFINDQIHSILENSYKDIKLIIRDDGSRDNTENVINNFLKQYPDKIILISDNQKGLGAKGNFFELLKYVKSDYVMFCDQDDYWFPEKIEKAFVKISNLEKEFGANTPIVVGSKVCITDSLLNPIEKQYMQIKKNKLSLNYLLVENQFPGCTLIFNKATLNLMRLIDSSKIEMHDWVCILLAKTYGVLDYIDEPLMYYRQHSTNVSGAANKTSVKYALKKAKDIYKICPYKLLYDQAYQLLKLNDANNGKINNYNIYLIKTFISMKNQKKYKKIYLTFKFNYFKSGIFRKIGQLIFI